MRISTRECAKFYLVRVEDDGVGFDEDMKKEDGRSHVGLKNVQSRLETQCGGTLRVQSEPGCGTVAEITIPREVCL